MDASGRQMMQRALSLARRGIGRTAPNPAVGCVIVKGGIIVGEGWHKKAGTPHAEVHALRQAGEKARGADVFVTLEPCSHHGRTPPCADALVEAGVAKVVAGMVDPNPLVSGRGLIRLRNAGIRVESGVLEEECRRLNESFIKHVTTGRPFVILKSAMTLDGKTATSLGDSKWITNDTSRAYVHKVRGMVEAVMVGSGTAVADDPLLTCRVGRGKNPVRIIVDSTLRTPLHAQVVIDRTAHTIVATTPAADETKVAALRAAGVEILTCRGNIRGVDLPDMLDQLGKRGIQSILLEGGGTLAGEALRHRLIDKFLFFYAPKLVAGAGKGPFAGEGVENIAAAVQLERVTVRRFGTDILVEGYPEGTCLPVS